jgi:hypothetical protein
VCAVVVVLFNFTKKNAAFQWSESRGLSSRESVRLQKFRLETRFDKNHHPIFRHRNLCGSFLLPHPSLFNPSLISAPFLFTAGVVGFQCLYTFVTCQDPFSLSLSPISMSCVRLAPGKGHALAFSCQRVGILESIGRQRCCSSLTIHPSTHPFHTAHPLLLKKTHTYTSMSSLYSSCLPCA